MSRNYDFIVIGGDLEGVLAAAALKKLGKQVLLVEAEDQLVPQFPSIFNVGTFEKLGELPFPVPLDSVQAEPVTWFQGSLNPFVGFGENAPGFVDFLKPYLVNQYEEIAPEARQFAQNLCKDLDVEVLLSSTVTHVDIENKKIENVTINGNSVVAANHVISTINPMSMTKWNKDLLTQKWIHKFGKAVHWTALTVEFQHTQDLAMGNGFIVLQGSHANDVAIGRAKDNTSQWLTLVPSEQDNNSEFMAATYKTMKKLVNKAFPLAVSNVTFEKLSVISQSHGHIPFKVAADNPILPFSNLWLLNSKMSDNPSPCFSSLDTVAIFLQELKKQGLLAEAPLRAPEL